MRRATTIGLMAAATVALALPAGAGAATKFYGGSINNGGKIGIDVTLQGGEAFQVDAMRFKNLPASCSVSGPSLIGSSYEFTNLLVTNNKFEIDAPDGSGGNLFFKGTFRNGDKKVEGKLQAILHFEGPSQDCTSAQRGYSAKRGAKGPHPQIPKALRVR